MPPGSPGGDFPDLDGQVVSRLSLSLQLAARLRTSLGLRRGEVRLDPADPTWPVIFHLLAAELLPQLPESVVAVEHVGSTAVPGLVAKPILDLAIGVRADADPAAATEALQRFGFLRRGDVVGPRLDRNFGFELEDRIRLVNAHLVTYRAREWDAYLEFRDRLRADPRARDRYASIKITLARHFPDDRTAYVDGKTGFIRDDSTGVPPAS